MLLTRFWNVLVAMLLGAAVFVLYLAVSMYNRAGARTMAERLSSDTQVVSWYLKEDARERAAQLIQFAVNAELARALQKSNESEAKVPPQCTDKVHKELKTILDQQEVVNDPPLQRRAFHTEGSDVKAQVYQT